MVMAPDEEDDENGKNEGEVDDTKKAEKSKTFLGKIMAMFSLSGGKESKLSNFEFDDDDEDETDSEDDSDDEGGVENQKMKASHYYRDNLHPS